MPNVSPSPSAPNRPHWQPALLALLLVWAVAILPSALPRPWGLLDEQAAWSMATSHGWMDMLIGRNDCHRYRPVHWFYYAAIAYGLGPSRTAHHLVQASVLALFGGGYMLLMAHRAQVQSWLAWSLPALLFVQAPLAENTYTLAKPDWMAALGLLGTLAFGLLALTRLARWPWWLLAAGMCAGGAALVKESGLVAVGTVVLLGLAGYAARSWRGRGLLIWQAVAVLLFVGTYWLPSKYLIQPTTYRLTLADLSLRSMAFNGYIYLTKYPELFLLGGGALAGLWADRQRLGQRHPVALLAGVAFLSGLAVLGLLIVWKWPCGYFLMPVVACWLIALLLTADALVSLPRPGRQVVIGLGLLWLTLNVAGFAQTARLQRACWHGCGMFVETYVRQGAPDSRLFFPEQVSRAEVPSEANNQIRRLSHERLGALAGASAFALGDDPDNADLRLPTAGDYLALRHYARAFGKHVRLFEDCATDRLLPRLEALGWQLARVGTYHFQMLNFVPGRDLGRTVHMEHDLYRLDAPPPVHFALNGGRWRTDDWSGPRLTLLVNRPGRLVITGEIPAGHPAPTTIDSLVEGVTANRQTLSAGQSSTWEIVVAGASPGQPVTVTLHAAPALPAEQLGLRPKGELLAWQLRHIRFIPDER